MADVELRLVVGDDWQLWRSVRLRALQDEPTAFAATYEREVALGEQDWRGWLDHDGPAVLAMAGADPVGMGAGFQDLDGWLHLVALWVDPAWRGRGIGYRMLEHLVSWARARGLRAHLDVTVGNGSARRIYERFGFTPTGQVRPLREGSKHDVERMVFPD